MSGRTSKLLRWALYFILFCVLLRACGVISFTDHEHDWQEATCTAPSTCATCGETEGEPLGHQWTAATCQAPKTCARCGETRGTTAGHDWISATCTAPKTCAVCGETKGEPLGHRFYSMNWYTTRRPTCQEEGERTNTCSRCGLTVTESVPVIACTPGNWETVEEESTSTVVIKAQYCTMCGKELDRKQLTLSGGGGGSGGGGSGGGGGTVYDNQGQQNTTATYVLNTSTMKFHRPSCRDVPRISSANYSTSSQSRDYLISIGYSPCGHCSP